jgi:hypothetical protein
MYLVQPHFYLMWPGATLAKSDPGQREPEPVGPDPGP